MSETPKAVFTVTEDELHQNQFMAQQTTIIEVDPRDARIAELEAALRKSRVFVKVMNQTGGNLAKAQVALLERIDKLLSKGE